MNCVLGYAVPLSLKVLVQPVDAEASCMVQ